MKTLRATGSAEEFSEPTVPTQKTLPVLVTTKSVQLPASNADDDYTDQEFQRSDDTLVLRRRSS